MTVKYNQKRMQIFHSRLINLILVSSFVCITYLFILFFLFQTSKSVHTYSYVQDARALTTIEHIVFGIASNQNSWPKRKEYVKLWWKGDEMRGCVFLESLTSNTNTNTNANANTSQPVDDSLPPICISEDTSHFRYTYKGGDRSAIRVARVVLETVLLNHSDVRWYVFGDDDTVFLGDNLVKTLSKYDHELWYYIGANSEIHEQNNFFAFGMAFGGAGFAISYPLAKALAKKFDLCIQRYPHLYGSDSRVYSCLTELGVSLTHESGFHQFDVHGNVFGLLASHPLTPLISLHHIDHMDFIFPNMTTIKALRHLFEAVKIDSERILQQSICYDRWFSWTISVSWGYAVQVFGNHLFLPDVLPVQETFQQWRKGSHTTPIYNFNTKKLHPDPCQRPTILFFDSIISSGTNEILSIYKKMFENCSYDAGSPRKLKEVRVLSTKLDLTVNQLKAPRRKCCDVLPSSDANTMDIVIRDCKQDELQS